MAFRDRTEEFLRLRASHRPDLAATSDTAPLTGGDSAGRGALAIELREAPEWQRFFELIRHTQQQIQRDQHALEGMQHRHLKVEFGVARDPAAEEREIEEQMRGIVTRFEEADADLKALRESYIEEVLSGPDGGSPMQRRLLANVEQCLKQELSALNRAVRDGHKRYMRNLERQHLSRLRSSGSEQHAAIEAQVAEQARMELYLAKGCTQEQVEQIMLNTRRVHELDREYAAILTNVKALHDMFADLNTMVAEQGTILDQIEYNMHKTYDSVRKAKGELAVAKGHQEAAGSTMCFILLCVLVGGFVLALFIKAFIP
jgi:hypothetical protein